MLPLISLSIFIIIILSFSLSILLNILPFILSIVVLRSTVLFLPSFLFLILPISSLLLLLVIAVIFISIVFTLIVTSLSFSIPTIFRPVPRVPIIILTMMSIFILLTIFVLAILLSLFFLRFLRMSSLSFKFLLSKDLILIPLFFISMLIVSMR